jgi:Glycosyltransferase family 87
MKSLNFGVLIAFIGISLMFAWLAFSFGGEDFNVYYAAARITLQGGNPYDYGQLTPEIISVSEINNPYYYAPWFTWFVLPLGFLPYNVARSLWAIINVLLWFLGLINLGKLIPWPDAGWKRWAAFTLVTLLFAWTTWGFEQVGVLIFFLLTIALLAIEREKLVTAGIFLALLLFKPNITVLPVAAILAWLILRKKWKPVIVTIVATFTMLAVSILITPGWYKALLQVNKLTGLFYKFDTASSTGVARYNTTLMDWLAAYNINGTVAVLIYVVVILLGLAIFTLTIARTTSLIPMIAVALLVNFAIVPYILSYDYPALAITLFHANNLDLSKSYLKYVRMAINILVISGLFIGNKISYRYWIVIAISLLMIFKYIATRTESIGRSYA